MEKIALKTENIFFMQGTDDQTNAWVWDNDQLVVYDTNKPFDLMAAAHNFEAFVKDGSGYAVNFDNSRFMAPLRWRTGSDGLQKLVIPTPGPSTLLSDYRILRLTNISGSHLKTAVHFVHNIILLVPATVEEFKILGGPVRLTLGEMTTPAAKPPPLIL